MTDYRKLDLDKIRADLARAIREQPPLVTSAKALLETLKPELLEMLRVGYSVRDITDRLQQHGVTLKLGTVQFHLRQMRAANKKPRRRSPSKPEAAAQPTDMPALADSQSKAAAADLFDQSEDEIAF